MLKNILKLDGAQELTNREQKTIKGGWIPDLSQICGYYVFNSTESQCLSLSAVHQPVWNPTTRKCSALGTNTNCND
jgi:hypothetical protein